MKGLLDSLSFGILLAIFLSACSKPWQETIRYGNIENSEFDEIVEFTEKIGLAIVPVSIDGQEYNFLFDTGAPLTISKKIQAKQQYKVVSRAAFRDSENIRTEVDYVTVPAINIGAQTFSNQTAVVTSFDNNPLIACLEIDGIIGSNIMRYCNWTIDFDADRIRLFTKAPQLDDEEQFYIPFKASDQYGMKIDLKIGRASLTNVTVDYGSNGSISVPNRVYNTMVDNDIIKTLAISRGQSQSGISGKIVEKDRAYAIADSVDFGEFYVPEVDIRSGSSGLLGTDVLARYVVTIDWNNQRLIFTRSSSEPHPKRKLGIQLGLNNEGKVFVLSVLAPSPAWQNGIRAGQRVKQLDDYHFNSTEDYCEYVQENPRQEQHFNITVVDSTGRENEIVIERFEMTKLK